MNEYHKSDVRLSFRCLSISAFFFLLFSWTAMPASTPTTMTTPAANNSSVDLGKNVELATTRASWIFRAYMLTIVVGAAFSYWVWKSGNDAQSAVQAEAAVRIGEADAAGKKAQEAAGIANKAAGEANERTK
ncbi:MAG TPA: hypothetical protein VKC51_07010, partial [Lacunisphaera sp.]|nr:hypothetical protein [Lacunisphaera sp.]